MTRLFDLTGRTAMVTGARSGIGRAIAIALAEAGADLVLHGHRDDLDDTETAVKTTGRRVRRWVRDMSHPDGLAEEAAALVREEPVDILVNNAGIIRRAPALTVDMSQWRDVLTVNLDAVFTLTRAVGAPMVDRGRGKVITIASLLSFQGGLNVVAYTASKHAVVGMTRALANEWAPHGVQVNALAPGYIATGNTAPLRAHPSREPEIRARIPAGRWGTPNDLAGAAVFLASAASDYVCGHVLTVDGGWLGR
ncbi:2-deoxy-D-gluconate 3-dehydrogenase [Micromonospora globispora]|uniref:2-deoxy-D-gluconate 3-dehydrogenase n=1 Tax=Micromonospora globispora TaxID=1450148 RepID=A0A317K4L8_9ACTN|nr:SDR family oxidoreductase [Micromonospora globispora]PWU47580.1 2-deoxy-D-gluconate 3-dehydrogenase [Micromonospora globispora]PWU56998.1 2-deoxy-D-gluconate 3-dehydrogenase [Micromonospora globispora]RQW95481.1 2-deoxy-D-gluconate 3-dehydrogenase [Micromonospora globispora]